MQAELFESIDATAAPKAVAANTIVLALTESEVRRAQLRRSLSALAVFAGCIFWFLTLAILHATTEGLPWYVTSASISIVCALVVAQPRASRFYFRKDKALEPLSLMETWAIAYLGAAVALYAWVFLHSLMPPSKEPKLVQFVDIQLVSPTDFRDQKSPLPGSQEQDQLRKRQSDRITAQGALLAKQVAAVSRKRDQSKVEASANEKPVPQDVQPKPAQKTSSAPALTPLVSPSAERPLAPKQEKVSDRLFVKPMPRLVPVQSGTPTKSPLGGSPVQQPLFEEVQPPEMVEMIENDGAIEAAASFQSGGSSAGGKGAANALAVYIKELHRRIKQGWAPPRGQSRQAGILFRIKKDGRLSFLKLTTTSGDSDTDEAAIKAVMSAVKTHALPPGYTLPYLDVQYTFNYTADEIKEVNGNTY